MLRSRLSRVNHTTKFLSQFVRLQSTNSSKVDVSSEKYSSLYSITNQFADLDTFSKRHLGPKPKDVQSMLKDVNSTNMSDFISKVIPEKVFIGRKLAVQPLNGYSETEMIDRLKELASKNKVYRSYIGKGYYYLNYY